MKITRPKQHTQPSDRHRIWKTRALNDKLRITGKGGFFRLSKNAWALSYLEYMQMRQAMAAYSDFNSENDPSGTHESGQFNVGNWKGIWEFEYQKKGGGAFSPDPSDPTVTTRVLHVEVVPEWW
ncbi:DUF3768 domain-containing protein [Blastomonas fulva]|uniref:DUF3768 domain-containing protein n=1 Tax=Blastomonas fulva TaxID=1550728 RepID=UPI003D2C95CB